MAAKTRNTSKQPKKSPKKPGDPKDPKPKGEPSKGDVKAFLRREIATHAATLKREWALGGMYLGRSLGVGNIRTFAKEFEDAYARSALLKKDKDSAYGAPISERPQLKKVSQEIAESTPNKQGNQQNKKRTK